MKYQQDFVALIISIANVKLTIYNKVVDFIYNFVILLKYRNKLQNFNIIGNSITKGLQLLQNYFFIYRNMYNYK